MNTRYFHNEKTGQITQIENVWGEKPFSSDWREIYKDEFIELYKSSKEDAAGVTDRIFDTLMGNVGMSDYHLGFDNLTVTEQECDSKKGLITFWVNNGRVFQIKVTEIEDPYEGQMS